MTKESMLANDIKTSLINSGIPEENLSIKPLSGMTAVNAGDQPVCWIKAGKKVQYVKVRAADWREYCGGISDAHQSIKPEGTSYVRLLDCDTADIEQLAGLWTQIYERLITESHSFGCCHLYLQCSDARSCVNQDKSMANACIYNTRLKAGIIYYGKNRNVD